MSGMEPAIIGSLISAAGAIGSTLLAPKAPKAPKAVAAPKQAVMPVADDEAMQRSKKLSMVRQLGRSGRSSTLLATGENDSLGG